MAKRRPIHQAISEVLRSKRRALTPEEIYGEIVRLGLYDFRAKDPIHVVRTQARRHCKDLSYPSAKPDKYFGLVDGDRYVLLRTPLRVEPTAFKVLSGHRRKPAIVTVPSDDPPEMDNADGEGPTHTEIQWRLLDLGARLGLAVWAPMNDRGRTWGGRRIGDIANLLPSLPRQFDPATTRTIGFIDVIWFEQRPTLPIVAAFEVEHTSPVYSGLLRMCDLMTMQPNLEIKWYLVAPDHRFDKFTSEIGRPSFANLDKPLHTICGFLPYGRLLHRLREADAVIAHLRPAFLDDIAQMYDPAEAFED